MRLQTERPTREVPSRTFFGGFCFLPLLLLASNFSACQRRRGASCSSIDRCWHDLRRRRPYSSTSTYDIEAKLQTPSHNKENAMSACEWPWGAVPSGWATSCRRRESGHNPVMFSQLWYLGSGPGTMSSSNQHRDLRGSQFIHKRLFGQ